MSMMKLLSVAALFAATPAVAVTSTTVIITDDGQPVPRSSIHIIDTSTGAEIPVGAGSNADCRIAVDLPAGNYAVLVGKSTVGEFSVTGTGEKQVAFSNTRRIVPPETGCLTPRSTPGNDGDHDTDSDSGPV